MGLPYFYFLGIISAFLGLVPYLGLFFALFAPIAAGMGVINKGQLLIVFFTVIALHVVGMNLLYPKLIERAPDQAAVTEQVDHEHELIKTALDDTSAACTAWRQRPSADTGEALAAALDQLNSVVQPHLDDEEQKVVPLAAITLTQREWDALGKHWQYQGPDWGRIRLLR